MTPPDDSLTGLELLPNAYYSEEVLMKTLCLTRTWLRRSVGGFIAGKSRVYLGRQLLEHMKPVAAIRSRAEKPTTPRGRRLYGRRMLAVRKVKIIY